MVIQEIALEELTLGEVRNLAGHDRGISARDYFNIEALDKSDERIVVRVPANFRAISPSFFQGMFAESVVEFGDALKFLDHYRFDAPAHIRARIAEYAEQAAGRVNSSRN